MGDYWHGSPVVLEVGTTLTSLRSRRGAAMDATQYGYLSDNLHDPDRVYFTTDAELARAW